MHLENLFLDPADLATYLFWLITSATIIMDCEIQYHYTLFKQGCSSNYKSVANHLSTGKDNC